MSSSWVLARGGETVVGGRWSLVLSFGRVRAASHLGMGSSCFQALGVGILGRQGDGYMRAWSVCAAHRLRLRCGSGNRRWPLDGFHS